MARLCGRDAPVTARTHAGIATVRISALAAPGMAAKPLRNGVVSDEGPARTDRLQTSPVSVTRAGPPRSPFGWRSSRATVIAADRAGLDRVGN